MYNLIDLLQVFGGRGQEYASPGSAKPNFQKNIAGPKVSDTLKEAIGKKGAPINMERAYKDANPNYDNTGSFDEYNMNCQRCVVAYELRRRGYDVTALPTYDGDKLPQSKLIGNISWDRWQGAFRSAKPVSVRAETSETVVKNIEKRMKSYGNGARGVISITYKNSRIGHVFNVEQRKGKTYFVDAQDGKRVWAKNFMDIVDKSTVTLTRIDNLRLSDRAKNFVTAEDIYKRRK